MQKRRRLRKEEAIPYKGIMIVRIGREVEIRYDPAQEPELDAQLFPREAEQAEIDKLDHGRKMK